MFALFRAMTFPLAVGVIGWIFQGSFLPSVERLRLFTYTAGVAMLSMSWWCVGRLNEEAARSLQREIDALDALERQEKERQ